MSVSYQVDKDCGLLRLEVVGPTHLPSFSAAVDAAMREPDLVRGMGVLVDFTHVEGIASLDIAHGCVRAVARLQEQLGPVRAAAVTPREANLGITNAASVFARSIAGIELCGFRSIADAERWLAETGDGA